MNDRSVTCPGKCGKTLFGDHSTRKHFLLFYNQVQFLRTSCIQSSGLSTPGSCTFWAFVPGLSAPTLWWSSFSPYQTKARTISEAWACLVDWTEAWTASETKQKTTEELWNTMREEGKEGVLSNIHRKIHKAFRREHPTTCMRRQTRAGFRSQEDSDKLRQTKEKYYWLTCDNKVNPCLEMLLSSSANEVILSPPVHFNLFCFVLFLKSVVDPDQGADPGFVFNNR